MAGQKISKKTVKNVKIAVAAAFLLLGVFYYRQFRKTVKLSFEVDQLFYPAYRLNGGYFIAKLAPHMQNQARGAHMYLAPIVRKELLQNENWRWLYNVYPEGLTSRYTFSAQVENQRLRDSQSEYAFKLTKLVVTKGYGTSEHGGVSTTTFYSNPDAQAFFLGGHDDPPKAQVAPELQFASEALAMGGELFRNLYPGRKPGKLEHHFKVVQTGFKSDKMFWPDVEFVDKSTSTVLLKPVAQATSFSVRSYRNYYLEGYYEFYIDVEPGPDNTVLERLKGELDQAAVKEVDPAVLGRLNCVNVYLEGDKKQQKRLVRAGRCAARLVVKLVDGKIATIDEEFTEEPLTVRTWACDKKCQSRPSSTVVAALNLTAL